MVLKRSDKWVGAFQLLKLLTLLKSLNHIFSVLFEFFFKFFTLFGLILSYSYLRYFFLFVLAHNSGYLFVHFFDSLIHATTVISYSCIFVQSKRSFFYNLCQFLSEFISSIIFLGSMSLNDLMQSINFSLLGLQNLFSFTFFHG